MRCPTQGGRLAAHPIHEDETKLIHEHMHNTVWEIETRWDGIASLWPGRVRGLLGFDALRWTKICSEGPQLGPATLNGDFMYMDCHEVHTRAHSSQDLGPLWVWLRGFWSWRARRQVDTILLSLAHT